MINDKGNHENHNPNSDKNNPTNDREIITKNINSTIDMIRNEIGNRCIAID